MTRAHLLTVAAGFMVVLAARPAAAQCSIFSTDAACRTAAEPSVRATFVPGAVPVRHRPALAPSAKPAVLPTPHRPAAAIDCAMAVQAAPNIDQRMSLLHPPPDIKFSMRLIIVSPCKR